MGAEWEAGLLFLPDNKMQFGFMPGKGTVDAIFIVRRMQEEYQKKDKEVIYVFC